MLSLAELQTAQIPSGAKITLLESNKRVDAGELKLEIRGDDLLLVQGDEVAVVEGVLKGVVDVEVVALEQLSPAVQGSLASLLAEEGYSVSEYGFTGEAVGISPVFALGGALALFGSGGGSSTPTSTPIPTAAVTITQSVDDSGSDDVITLTFTFDEDVTGFDASDVAITGGTKGVFTAVSASSYTLEVTSTSADTAISFSVAQGAATTLADGTASAAASGSFDLAAPALQSVATSAADQTITLTFDEAMGDVSASAFAVGFDGGAAIAPTSAVASGSTIVLTFAPGSFAAGDAISIGFTAADGALEDSAGNDAESFNITSGLTADGYIKAANIYLELEDGSRVNTGMVTDAIGNFFVTDEVQSLIDGISGDYSLVAIGGYNVDTGLPNTQEMRAPEGSTVINPLTTLIDQAYQQTKASGGTLAEAQALVKFSLNITTAEDLTTYDPISGADSADTDEAALALEAQQAAAQVATIIAYAEAGSGDSTTSEAVVDAMVAKIVAAETIDLTSTAVITELTGETDADKLLEVTTTTTDISTASVDGISTLQAALLDEIAPAVGAVSLTVASDTGSSSNDGLVNTSAVDVKVALEVAASDGTSVALGDTVSLFVDGAGSPLATLTVTDSQLSKGFAIFTGVTLSSETTSFTAKVTDKAGNESALSDAYSVTLDQTAPVAALTSPISEGYINAAEDDVALIIEGTAVGAEAGQKVTLTLVSNPITDPITDPISVTKSGLVTAEAFSIKVSAYDLQKLLEGTVTVTATVVDAAGNSDSASASYVYDKSAPAAPGNLVLSTDSGNDSADSISTSLEIQAITGVETTATAEYRVNGGAWSETYTAPTIDGEYTIEARQTDAAGNVSPLASLDAVLDTTAPTITSADAAKVAENSSTDSVVYTATSSDANGVLYSLASGSDAALIINEVTGEVRLTTSPDLSSQTSYEFIVVSTDAAGNSSQKTVTLEVTNVNEEPAVAQDGIPDFTAVTRQSLSKDLSVYFTDADIEEVGDSLTFSLQGELPPGLVFDPKTGVISGKATDTQVSTKYTVTATDESAKSASATFNIVAVERPVISSVDIKVTADDSIYAAEGEALTVTVVFSENLVLSGNLDGSTIDLGTLGTATFVSFDSNKTMVFTISSAPALNLEDITITSVTLAEGVTLTGLPVADDGSGQEFLANQFGDVTPDLEFVLDNLAPKFTSQASAVNEGVGENQVIYTAATDDTTPVLYTKKLGLSDDASSVEVDLNTGEVTLSENPDYETKTSYSFTVVATDGAGNVSEKAVTVGVNDIDEVAPTITSADSASAINENSGAGQVVYTVTSDDSADTSEGVTYSLKDGNDAALFSIDEVSGEVTLAGKPDAETKALYTFVVVADDGVTTPTEKTVTLAINDLDEVAPTITSAETATSLDENSGAGQVVYTVTSDDSADISAGVTYDLSGTDATLFSINQTTGVVSLTGDPDAETKASYSFVVVADDGVTTPTEKTVTLAINDLDEVAPIITSDATATSLDENSDAGQVVYTVTSDDSADISAGVTYSLKVANDAALFSIDEVSGEVTLTGKPDAETKALYTFVVVADDGVTTPVEKTVTLNINDLDEVAPTITSSAVGSVVDNSGAGKVVYTVTSDDTKDISAGVTYDIKGTDASLFTIDKTTGKVTLTDNPDIDIKSQYTFTVVASDGVNPDVEQVVTLDVVSAPVLTTTLEGVTNFDPRSDIVFSISEAVSWGADGTYHITITNESNDATKPGFQGENVINTQTISVTVSEGVASFSGGSVSFDNTTKLLIINPEFDLDLANNYSISIDPGMFVGNSSSLASISVTDINFSTVTPSEAVAIDGLSKYFSGLSADLSDSSLWVDGNQGAKTANNPTQVALDVSAEEVAIAFGINSLGQTSDAYLVVSGFTADDAIYLDNLGDNELVNLDGIDSSTSTQEATFTKDFAAVSGSEGAQARLVITDIAADKYFVLEEMQSDNLLFIG